MKLRFNMLTAISCAIVTATLGAQTTPAGTPPNLLETIESKGDFKPVFPFQIDLVPQDNLTNVQTWPTTHTPLPAGKDGTVLSQDGVFVDGAHTVTNPLRFLGTNICFGGCFPERKEAEDVARALARFGINSVRLHYSHHIPPKKGYNPPDNLLVPDQLDRFDYLFAQLKKNGIYVYMQLNIGRKFNAQQGFENASRLPWYNHGLDNFEPRMIRLHKKFISDFLNHVNPYTKLPYKDDSAIANLEITNENSIVIAWFRKKYNFPGLPEPYASLLKSKWNDFLSKKYQNTDNLKKAWGLHKPPVMGPEMMPEAVIMTDVKNAPKTSWGLQLDPKSVADWKLLPAQPTDTIKGKFFARLKVTSTGLTPNMPQFYRTDLTIRNKQPYTFSFAVRSRQREKVSVRLSQHHDPWQVAGFRATVDATPEWQTFSFPFIANMDDPKVRMVFADFTPGTYDIADLSLREGLHISWDPSQNLEARTMPCPDQNTWTCQPQRARDFVDFLMELEASYIGQLYHHVKHVVKAKQPVTGTQLEFGSNLPQGRTDYCDAHAYWSHPMFPLHAWDANNWYLINASILNHIQPASTFTALARLRILGKPFTVSEYDHPNTNLYHAEGNVLLAAMAALQNWSGIYQFAWTHSRDFNRRIVSGMFDMCSATTKLAHLPACYAMFVRGDVKQAPQDTVFAVPSTRQDEVNNIAAKRSMYITLNPSAKTLPFILYTGKLLTDLPQLYDLKGKRNVHDFSQLGKTADQLKQRRFKDAQQQITWDFSNPKAGFVLVDTPNTKVFTGTVCNRTFAFKGLSLIPGKNRLDWLTLSLTNTTPATETTDSNDILQPGTYLLAATGICHNTDAYVADLGINNRVSISSKLGGKPGHEPILCEGITATLKLKGLPPGRIQCQALDPSGNPQAEVPISQENGQAVITISPDYRTIWYQLIVK